MLHDPGARTRRRWALVLNAVAPGVGLVVFRREWLGLAIALLFSLLAQVALWGWWITPATIPVLVSAAAGVAAGVVWAGAQWLACMYARRMPGVSAAQELKRLQSQADQAAAHERFDEARDLLQMALTINDDDVELQVRWARLMSLTGDARAARSAWKTVLKLDAPRPYRTEAAAAVERLASLKE